MYDAVDMLDELEVTANEMWGMALDDLRFSSIPKIWATSLERNPECVRSALLRLGVIDGAMEDEVKHMMRSSDVHMR